MKTVKILIVLFVFGAFLPSCVGDIEDLADPRDAIAKKFRVTETEVENNVERSYDDVISKDASEKTGIIFSNFNDNNLKVKATFDGKNLIINQQTIGDYIIKGSGTLTSDLKTINLQYTVDEEQGANPVEFSASYGVPQVAKKLKVVK